MNKIEKIAYKIGEGICIVSLLLLVIIVVWIVIGRFVFNSTPAWGEELAILCMIYFGLIGSSLAEKDGKHIRISVLDTIYPPVLTKIFRIAFYLFKLAFSVIVTVCSFKLVLFSRNSYMAGIHLSDSVTVFAGVIMGLLMFFFLLTNFKKEVLGK